MYDEINEAAALAAARLVRERGLPPSVAAQVAADAAVEFHLRRRRGLGAVTDAIKSAADIEPIKEARELVSPWLWVLSVISFGMAVTNYQRVSTMFRKWKRGKKAS